MDGGGVFIVSFNSMHRVKQVRYFAPTLYMWNLIPPLPAILFLESSHFSLSSESQAHLSDCDPCLYRRGLIVGEERLAVISLGKMLPSKSYVTTRKNKNG